MLRGCAGAGAGGRGRPAGALGVGARGWCPGAGAGARVWGPGCGAGGGCPGWRRWGCSRGRKGCRWGVRAPGDRERVPTPGIVEAVGVGARVGDVGVGARVGDVGVGARVGDVGGGRCGTRLLPHPLLPRHPSAPTPGTTSAPLTALPQAPHHLRPPSQHSPRHHTTSGPCHSTAQAPPKALSLRPPAPPPATRHLSPATGAHPHKTRPLGRRPTPRGGPLDGCPAVGLFGLAGMGLVPAGAARRGWLPRPSFAHRRSGGMT